MNGGTIVVRGVVLTAVVVDGIRVFDRAGKRAARKSIERVRQAQRDRYLQPRFMATRQRETPQQRRARINRARDVFLGFVR